MKDIELESGARITFLALAPNKTQACITQGSRSTSVLSGETKGFIVIYNDSLAHCYFDQVCIEMTYQEALSMAADMLKLGFEFSYKDMHWS